MLDWTSLHREFEGGWRESHPMRLAFVRLHQNATTRLLRNRGYEIVFPRSSYPPLNHSLVADVHVPRHAVADLKLMWFQTTILAGAMVAISDFVPCTTVGLGFSSALADLYEDVFGQIASVSSSGRPLFGYQHVLLPHEPFLSPPIVQHAPRSCRVR